MAVSRKHTTASLPHKPRATKLIGHLGTPGQKRATKKSAIVTGSRSSTGGGRFGGR